jgi:hypothetical protein
MLSTKSDRRSHLTQVSTFWIIKQSSIRFLFLYQRPCRGVGNTVSLLHPSGREKAKNLNFWPVFSLPSFSHNLVNRMTYR